MVKVAINGFGRIGRMFFRKAHKEFDIIAINDLTDAKTLGHLLKYDSVHGKFTGEIKAKENALVVDGKEHKILSERDPEKLPWKELGIEVVVECTGVFRTKEGAGKHITAGAKKVVISAPAKGEMKTIVMGVNDETLSSEDVFVSNASCTTNCLAPVVKVLDREFKVVSGFMNTIHAYTNDQKILDLPHSDLRRARTAAYSIIPTTTGAAKAIGLVLPEVDGKMSGFSLRVPIPCGSITDIVCQVEKKTSVEEVNAALKKAAETDLKGFLQFSEEELVSIDIIDNPFSSIVDSKFTDVKGHLVRVFAWYDNEWAYALRLIDIINKMSK